MRVRRSGQRRAPAGPGHVRCPEIAWDCGCGRHLEASSEEALIAKVLYHLEVHHPETHFTMEQAEELVRVEAYEELVSRGNAQGQRGKIGER